MNTLQQKQKVTANTILQKLKINNTIGIDVNINNFTSVSIIDNKIESYYEIFETKEPTITNNSIKNKKFRKNQFFIHWSKKLKVDLNTLYINRKEILQKTYKNNPVYILYNIFKNDNIPDIGLTIGGKDYSKETISFFIISLWFLNHRGAKTLKNEYKDQSAKDNKVYKNLLKDVILNMPDNLSENQIHLGVVIRRNNTNYIFNQDKLGFFNQDDNKSFYEDFLRGLSSFYNKRTSDISNSLFYMKSQKGRKEEKRGLCSFLYADKDSIKKQSRGDMNNPYQEVRIAHSTLNISNEFEKESLKESYEKKFLVNLKKGHGFIKNILLDVLNYTPTFLNNEIIFKSKTRDEIRLDMVSDMCEFLYSNCIDNKKITSYNNDEIEPIIFTTEEKEDIYEYYEDFKSSISSVSNEFSKLYCENLSLGINTTANKLNLLIIDEYYNNSSNRDKIRNGESKDINSFYQEIGIYKVVFVDQILKSEKKLNFKNKHTKTLIKKEIEKHINETLKKKWTDPNVIQKMFIFSKYIVDTIYKNDIKSKQDFQNALDKVSDLSYIIESTRQKVEPNKQVSVSMFNNILNDYSNVRIGLSSYKRNRLLYETNGVDVYDGQDITDGDIEHVVPKSWSTIYGNLLHNLVVTKNSLNKIKNDNLPLLSPLNLNPASFKKRINLIYSNNRINSICDDITNYIKTRPNSYIEYTDNSYRVYDDLILYKKKTIIDKKTKIVTIKWQDTKICLNDYLEKYFTKKKNILLLQCTKSELESDFSSNLINNISHSVGALTDVLTDIFGVDRKNIQYTPREFSYVNKFRKEIELPKDRDWNQHHIIDCYLLLFLSKRKNVFDIGSGYIPNLNDRYDFIPYFKDSKSLNFDLKDTHNKKDLIDSIENLEENINITYKKDRAFKKRKDKKKDIYTFTPRGQMFQDTIYSVYIKDDNKNKVYTKKKLLSNLSTNKKYNDFSISRDPNDINTNLVLIKKTIKGIETENITQKDLKITHQEKTCSLFLNNKVCDSKYQAKRKSRKSTHSAIIGKKYKVVNNKFNMIDKESKIRKLDLDNKYLLKKKDVFMFENYHHIFNSNSYIINGKYKIDAINTNIKLTNVLTSLKFDSKKDIAKKQLENDIAICIGYDKFYIGILNKNIQKV